MTRQEILCTPIGEMQDMISCLAIYEGTAEQKIEKAKKKHWSYDEAIALR